MLVVLTLQATLLTSTPRLDIPVNGTSFKSKWGGCFIRGAEWSWAAAGVYLQLVDSKWKQAECYKASLLSRYTGVFVFPAERLLLIKYGTLLQDLASLHTCEPILYTAS